MEFRIWSFNASLTMSRMMTIILRDFHFYTSVLWGTEEHSARFGQINLRPDRSFCPSLFL